MTRKPDSKKARILAMLASGETDRHVIAAAVGVRPDYVNQVQWHQRNAAYAAQWMREHRADPAVSSSELAQQADRYATDPEFRCAIRERTRAWQRQNPERMRELRRRWRLKQGDRP